MWQKVIVLKRNSDLVRISHSSETMIKGTICLLIQGNSVDTKSSCNWEQTSCVFKLEMKSVGKQANQWGM